MKQIWIFRKSNPSKSRWSIKYAGWLQSLALAITVGFSEIKKMIQFKIDKGKISTTYKAWIIGY